MNPGFINHWETKPQVGERMNPGRSLHGLQDSLELSDGKGILKVENSMSAYFEVPPCAPLCAPTVVHLTATSYSQDKVAARVRMKEKGSG